MVNSKPSELGKAIHSRRTDLGMSLRELARRIGKTPSYLVSLERSPVSPGATDETLKAIATNLELEADEIFGLANRVPAEAEPKDALDVSLYRALGELTSKQKSKLLTYIYEINKED